MDDVAKHLEANDKQCSIDAHNNPLTDEALAAAKGADAIILGAVGGPVWHLAVQLEAADTNM